MKAIPDYQRPLKICIKLLKMQMILMPGVIVECGFLSNKQDLELLKNGSIKKGVAESIWKSIKRIL